MTANYELLRMCELLDTKQKNSAPLVIARSSVKWNDAVSVEAIEKTEAI